MSGKNTPDTFPVLLGAAPDMRSPTIWKSSRFCIDREILEDRGSNQVTAAAAELMCGVGEMGLSSGFTHIVTVTDIFLERMFRRMRCRGERLGAPQKIGEVHAVAISRAVDDSLLSRMKAVAEIDGTVLLPQTTVALARAA